jgi:HK97 family phage major capsid protein
MAAQLISRESREPVLKILADNGYQALADVLGSVTVNGKAVNTLVSSEGGVLVPTPVSGGIMPLLRAESTFINAGPVRVPLTNGQFVLARGLAGATASYIAEGALKPVSTPTFDSISMRAKKLAGIVPITEEAVRWTIGDIEAYVRNDLRNALALTLDLNAWLGTGAGASPLGILNKVGVQTLAPTFASATAPTLAELDTFASAMIMKLVTVNIFSNPRWRWVMPYRSAMKLGNMRVGAGTDGDFAFPEMNLGRAGGPNWKGFPVIITSQIPTTGGGTTDETTIALVDFSHVLFGEEEGINTKMSDTATLNVDGGSTLVHLWQQNMIAILAEAMHDFGLRTVKAVVKATVRW